MQPKQRGTVFFDTQPHGAKIYVDGQLLVDPDTEESLRTPEKVLLFEGRRNFTFVLDGHKDVSGYVDVWAGATVSIFRNMEPGKSEEGWGEPEPQIWLDIIMQPKQKGIVHFDSQPRGADIIVDGQILVNPDTEESVKTPATVSLYEGRYDFILRLHWSNDAIGYVDVWAGTRRYL